MTIDRLLKPLKDRIRLMVGKCVISACAGKTVDLSALTDETRDDVDFYQHFGFSSVPVKGSDGVVLFIGGSRDNGIVIATRGDRPDLQEGEVCVHSPFGSSITLKKDGTVELVTNSKKFRFVGDVDVTGNVKAFCDSKFVTLAGHIHPTGVGPTSEPTPGK